MRASIATVLLAWTALTGMALVFEQLTQAQGFTVPGHPIISWSYWVFDGAVIVSVLAVVAGGLPLWRLMVRGARREHRPRDLAYLLLPIVVPVVYLTAAIVIVKLVRHAGAGTVYPRLNSVVDLANGGVGPWWFLGLIVLGFAAGGLFAAGPGLALRRLRPRGRWPGRQGRRPRGGDHGPRRCRQHCRRDRPLPVGTRVRRLPPGLAAVDIPPGRPAGRRRRHCQRRARDPGCAVACRRMTPAAPREL